MGIYVGYESPSIVKYLEPTTGDLFTACFVDFHFDESNFPTLGGENKKLEKKISWNELSLSHLDPRTKQCELEVQKIIQLQNLANQLPNAFTDLKGVTKSYILVTNAPIKIGIPVGQSNESQPRMKHGRPIGFKDKNPRRRKGDKNKDGQSEDIENLKETLDIINIPSLEEIDQVPETHENKEISISYVDIDDVFAYNIALNEINGKEDQKPMSIKICRQSEDWPK